MNEVHEEPTYEPGQRVLVEGVVEQRNSRGRSFHVAFRHSDAALDVHRADIVGSAPANRDEEKDIESWLRDLLAGCVGVRARLRVSFKKVATERDEARAALATAEARIAAALAVVDNWHGYDFLAHEIRRALSVEAAGTEGGGGHEPWPGIEPPPTPDGSLGL